MTSIVAENDRSSCWAETHLRMVAVAFKLYDHKVALGMCVVCLTNWRIDHIGRNVSLT